jgi:hypothetical protein
MTQRLKPNKSTFFQLLPLSFQWCRTTIFKQPVIISTIFLKPIITFTFPNCWRNFKWNCDCPNKCKNKFPQLWQPLVLKTTYHDINTDRNWTKNKHGFNQDSALRTRRVFFSISHTKRRQIASKRIYLLQPHTHTCLPSTHVPACKKRLAHRR